MNAEAEHGRGALEKELATATRDHTKLVDAIIAGIPVDQFKDKMQALSERRATLEAELSRTPAPDAIRIHPKVAATYQARVSALISGLNEADGLQEAQEALRSLVDRIVLQPSAETGKLDVMRKVLCRGFWRLPWRPNAKKA